MEWRDLREGWDALWAQWQKCAGRMEWLCDHQHSPLYAERDAAYLRSAEKLAVLREGLAELAGMTEPEVARLLAECWERELTREERMVA